MEDLKVKCKRCGRLAKASEYVLDPGYKLMVCPNCVKERRTREDVHKELDAQKKAKLKEQEALKDKPAGWDIEDEYLNKVYAAKMKDVVKVEEVSPGKVKYSCPKCKYKFVYDTERKMPRSCPYCSTGIQKMMF